ncbi:MAG: ribonuclease III [Okeania sp. SIO2D1]|nr:ribonuclease III [Okeania sp. SIO2D1]NET45543.1 ribonuclease III [Okeania sp. SIO2B3]
MDIESNRKAGLTRRTIGLQHLNLVALTPTEIQKTTPSSWAYLGDAIYELFIRSYYLIPAKRSRSYHQLVVAQVRAESQAHHLHNLKPHLTSLELDILKRGRNAAFRKPKRLDPEVYQQATSLEALIGYLYLTDPQRLNQLLGYIELD